MTAEAPTSAAGGVVLTWMLAGAAVGLALGITIQLTEADLGGRFAPADLATGAGLGCTLAMALTGAAALWVERGWAAARPAVADGRGELVRPVHAALYAVPLVIGAPALAGMVVVASLAMDSLAPAAVFGLGAVGLAWGAVRLQSAHRLRVALERLESGDTRAAVDGLRALATSPWSTRNTRATARLNLGLLALADGRPDEAVTWYAGVKGAGSPFALAGLAMARACQGQLDEADAAVLQAMSDPRGHLAQAWIDAVRLLVALRREGPAAARDLGERLHNAESGDLFAGLLASIRRADGDLAGARELIDDDGYAALDAAGWTRALPELAGLR